MFEIKIGEKNSGKITIELFDDKFPEMTDLVKDFVSQENKTGKKD